MIDVPRPSRFTAGTVGEPGHRTFFIQALSSDGELVSLKCEKQQVGALAEHLASLLADLALPEDSELAGADVDFVQPPTMAFTVGRIGVAWDEGEDRLILQCEELLLGDDDEGDDDPTDEDPPETARFRLTRAQVVAFVGVARGLVAAGRPPCYLCGMPMDPAGHACPRWN